MKKLCLVILFLCACETPNEVAQNKSKSLTYYKDYRTNLCFVYNTVSNAHGFDSHVFSNVPCSDKVSMEFDVEYNIITLYEEYCSFSFFIDRLLLNNRDWNYIKKRRYNQEEIFLIEKFAKKYNVNLAFT